MPGKKGFGAVLAYDSNLGVGSPVWVTITNITKLRPFNAKVDVLDMSSMDSPGERREKAGGFVDNGQLTFELNYDNKEVSHIWMVANLNVVAPFKLTYPGTSPKVSTFSGFVQMVSAEAPYDNKQIASCAIEINGVITTV